MNDNRDFLDPKSKGETVLTLQKLHSNGTNTEDFRVKKLMGSGRTCVVYLASYSSGGIEHNCLLKEVYPNDCGLIRDPSNSELFFRASSDEECRMLGSNKERYKMIRQKYIHAYEIQLSMISEENSKFTQDEKMMLSLGISSPQGLYENRHGVLYAVYNRDNGVVYSEYGTKVFPAKEDLYSITSIMIQAARIVNAFHKAGYLVLDIKESNMMITGGTDHRTVMFFDFGSLIKISELENYSFKYATIYDEISFTSSDSNLLLPPELQSIDRFCKNRNYTEAENIIKKNLFPYGTTTDMFLLSAILYKRIFGIAPELNMANANGDWEFPCVSKHIVIPELLNELKNIFSKTIVKFIKKRYSMTEFINELCSLHTLSILENLEDRDKFKNVGMRIVQTDVSKGILRTYSQKHWESLSGITGKFHHLTFFAERFDCKVNLEGEDKKKYSPIDVIKNNSRAFLYGDGGMGKSTAIFDFWSDQIRKDLHSSVICLYIDLSRYSSIRSTSQKETFLHGQMAENVPIELLTFIEVNILQAFGLFKNAARFGDAINDSNMSKQMSALHDILSKEVKSPEFILFLDGYNEIFDKSDRANFEINLSEAINIWKNAAIIVTSRSLPEEDDEDNIFNQFPRFKFIGIEDEEVCDTLQKYRNTDKEAIEKLKQDRLWEVLKIPMFLNMFLSINDENGKSIHTRGELLDIYIIQREKKTARRISRSSKMRDMVHSDSRNFMVVYALTFVANYLDSHKSFYMNNTDFFACIHNGTALYLKLDLLKRRFANKYSFNDLEDTEAKQILTVETGYCIYMTEKEVGFSHQYFRDYFAAKHIQNILNTAQSLDSPTFTKDEQLQFTKDYGLDYTWSDDVCILLGEIIGDYKNEPGYTEK